MKKLLTLALAALLTFCLSTCTFAEAEPAPDWTARMVEAAAAGDREGGKTAEAERNAWIDASQSGESKVSFDELCLLSRYIYAKAGSPRLSDEQRLCAGEVALNRVASPEFPDTLPEVVAQELPYAAALSGSSAGRLPRACAEAAMRLLLGERHMELSVVYQRDLREGDVYAIFGDKLLGFTYFCRSENTELYTGEE